MVSVLTKFVQDIEAEDVDDREALSENRVLGEIGAGFWGFFGVFIRDMVRGFLRDFRSDGWDVRCRDGKFCCYFTGNSILRLKNYKTSRNSYYSM